jgi:hypothetical protein
MIIYFVCPRTQRRHARLGRLPPKQQEAPMRVYIEVVLTIIGLLGAYVALLPIIT